MAGTRRLRELGESARARLVLPEGPLVVALSGGADSAALAWLCATAGRETRALHVNHGLTHSTALETAAQTIADGLQIELDVVHVEVPEGSSPEGQARRARYRAFADAVRQGESLLTAHTLDDDAETVLLNLVRGTGAKGLSGIPRRRPPLVFRPTLELRRSELRELAVLAGLGFVDDPMNEDLAISRNWVRHVIIPQLEAANPRIRESLHRTSDLIGRESALIEEMARSHAFVGEGEAAKVARSVLLTTPEPVASRILIAMVQHALGAAGVTSERVARMWSVVHGESASQEIGGGAIAELVGPMLVLYQANEHDERSNVTLRPGVQRVGRMEYEVLAVEGVSRVAPLSMWAAIFPLATDLVADSDGQVWANGELAWVAGEKRLPVVWYQPGTVGYLSVIAREGTGWTSSR